MESILLERLQHVEFGSQAYQPNCIGLRMGSLTQSAVANEVVILFLSSYIQEIQWKALQSLQRVLELQIL